MPPTINIVTTAALPWRTGTAILAMFRAYYLARRGPDVRLYLPWLPPRDQAALFGEAVRFKTDAAQADHIRSHLPEPACPSLSIEFYPAAYWAPLGSIVPTKAIANRLRGCDWLILEEPEHLNWKHPWTCYRPVSSRVTGIVLTQYRYYCAQAIPHGNRLNERRVGFP